MEETWLPIPSWEGLYEVSSLGRVRSLDREVSPATRRSYRKRGKIISLYTDKDGYPCCRLHTGDGGIEYHRVHRLVCLAFHGHPPTEHHVVAHGDGTRANNIPSNLRWATLKENTNDRRGHGTYPGGQTAPNVKILPSHAATIRDLLSAGSRQSDVAAQFGISVATVSAISSRRHWTDRLAA